MLQMDIRGSPFGFLAAHPFAPLISLHHLDYVQPIFPDTNRVDSVKKLINAHKSDPSRTLQHSICYDLSRQWSVSISWGYAVQLYPYMLTGKELNTPLQTFLTWGTWSMGPFTFNTRVMSLDRCQRPLVYYYNGAKSLGSKKTTTLYRRLNGPGKKKCELPNYARAYSFTGFNVSAPVMDPGFWNQVWVFGSC